MALLIVTTKKKSALFALILLSLYCWWAIHIISTSGISMIPISTIYSFSKVLGSLYRLTLTQANFRESSLQAWSWLTFRMFSPEYFCLNHQCFVLKYFKNFWDWGRGGRGGEATAPLPKPVCLCKFATGVGNKATGDSKLHDSPVLGLFLIKTINPDTRKHSFISRSII